MQKLRFNLNTIFGIIFLVLFCHFAYADEDIEKNDFYLDKAQVVQQQIHLLKNRIAQANNEYNVLENQPTNVSMDQISKQGLNWIKLDISVSKSNLDSIDIEIAEADQIKDLLENDTKELSNQINAYTIFGAKLAKTGGPTLNNLHAQLTYQKNLLMLEKQRLADLQDLQLVSDKVLQFYRSKYLHIEKLIKSQTVLQLKERQAKNEIHFQQQQDKWLQYLMELNVRLKLLEQTHKDPTTYIKLKNEIFYASENVNLMYLNMLIVRYQDQIQQLKLSSSNGNSIELLNKISDQVQTLDKQFSRVQDLLNERIHILAERKNFLIHEKFSDESYFKEIFDLERQYKMTLDNIHQLSAQAIELRINLDHAIQEELSSRQGLLGFGSKAWLDLGNEIVLVPTLTYEVGKNLTEVFVKALFTLKWNGWGLFFLLETCWLLFFSLSYRYLSALLRNMPDHARGHINMKWLFGKLLQHNLLDIAIIGNVIWFFILCALPTQYFDFLLDLGLVWLLFKGLIIMAKLCFVETMHDRTGDDVQIYHLYHRFKRTFWLGGVITAITVFLNQLPVYELKDLCYRFFLLFLAIVSLFLLKSHNVLSGLILPHIEEQRTYFKKIVRLLSVLIPLALLVNSLIGFFGFINFVLTISWYESIFFFVLAGYLIVRGLLGEFIDFLSRVLIAYVKNGWLWTEALLKPMDRILRIFLFFAAWVILFSLYGWDKNSPVVESLLKQLHYPLAHVLGTTITLVSIMELISIIFFLYWAARWIREFVYRFMSTRTSDLGIRTSIAILSQYTLIVCGVLIGLRLLGIDLKALTFIASAFALGVGLGLRDIANNFVCGFLLLFERPLRVGDTVHMGEFEGEVMHIGGRAVTIRTFDHMEVMIPNADIFSKIFTNWTGHDDIVRTVAVVKIHRHDNPQQIQQLIYQTLSQLKDVLNDPIPEVYLKELAEGLLEFEVRYYINLRRVKSRMSVRSEVLMAIWDVFEKAGVKPPYPYHEVFVNNDHVPLALPEKIF